MSSMQFLFVVSLSFLFVGINATCYQQILDYLTNIDLTGRYNMDGKEGRNFISVNCDALEAKSKTEVDTFVKNCVKNGAKKEALLCQDCAKCTCFADNMVMSVISAKAADQQKKEEEQAGDDVTWFTTNEIPSVVKAKMMDLQARPCTKIDLLTAADKNDLQFRDEDARKTIILDALTSNKNSNTVTIIAFSGDVGHALSVFKLDSSQYYILETDVRKHYLVKWLNQELTERVEFEDRPLRTPYVIDSKDINEIVQTVSRRLLTYCPMEDDEAAEPSVKKVAFDIRYLSVSVQAADCSQFLKSRMKCAGFTEDTPSSFLNTHDRVKLIKQHKLRNHHGKPRSV